MNNYLPGWGKPDFLKRDSDTVEVNLQLAAAPCNNEPATTTSATSALSGLPRGARPAQNNAAQFVKLLSFSAPGTNPSATGATAGGSSGTVGRSSAICSTSSIVSTKWIV